MSRRWVFVSLGIAGFLLVTAGIFTAIHKSTPSGPQATMDKSVVAENPSFPALTELPVIGSALAYQFRAEFTWRHESAVDTGDNLTESTLQVAGNMIRTTLSDCTTNQEFHLAFRDITTWQLEQTSQTTLAQNQQLLADLTNGFFFSQDCQGSALYIATGDGTQPLISAFWEHVLLSLEVVTPHKVPPTIGSQWTSPARYGETVTEMSYRLRRLDDLEAVLVKKATPTPAVTIAGSYGLTGGQKILKSIALSVNTTSAGEDTNRFHLQATIRQVPSVSMEKVADLRQQLVKTDELHASEMIPADSSNSTIPEVSTPSDSSTSIKAKVAAYYQKPPEEQSPEQRRALLQDIADFARQHPNQLGFLKAEMLTAKADAPQFGIYCRSLAQSDHPASQHVLTEVYRSREDEEHIVAILLSCFAQIQHPLLTSEQTVREITQHGNTAIRSQAFQVLGTLARKLSYSDHPEARARLADIIEEAHHQIRAGVDIENHLAVIGNIGDMRSRPILYELCGHKNNQIRAHAYFALRFDHSSETQSFLRTARDKEKDPYVQKKIEKALSFKPKEGLRLNTPMPRSQDGVMEPRL